MNVQKLTEDLYYYTDILNKEDQDFVLESIKNDDGWTRVYDFGDVYDPNRDPDAAKSQSCMIAYRKHFTPETNFRFSKIINAGFKKATEHYREDRNIVGGRDFPPSTHVDKHMQGTTYTTHIDTAPVGLESYTVLFYLNSDYSGGELSFSLPKADGSITVKNGILDYGDRRGPLGTYRPDHEKNADVIDFWIKTEPCSIVIFPPLKPYPHTAHEVTEGTKYMIKGYWQVTDEQSKQWSSNPYEGLSDQEIRARNPEGFIYDGEQHSLIKQGIDIVPEGYKNQVIGETNEIFLC